MNAFSLYGEMYGISTKMPQIVDCHPDFVE